MGNGVKGLIGFAALVIGAAPAFAQVCQDDRVTVQGDFGRAAFVVEVADTPEERAKGLMFVEAMPTLSGMLFVYDQPQRATFWMRNTLIPLDMLFVTPNGTISAIHENAQPMDDTTIDGGPGVIAVLEINGGLAARLGIAAGDVVQHPAFGPGAVLPCTG